MMRFFLFGLLSCNLLSCSHDEKAVRDEQRKEMERRRQQEKNELASAIGTYRGQLTIDGINHNLMIVIGSEPDPQDGKPVLTAQVWRTDIVFGRNSVLTGSFTAATGDLYLTTKDPNAAASPWDTSGIEGSIRAHQLNGVLKQAGTTLGTITLFKTSSGTAIENLDRCHEFYTEARKLLESMSGKYDLTLVTEHAARPPQTVDFFIRPNSDPGSLAMNGSIPSGVDAGKTFVVNYVPYRKNGTLFLDGTGNATGEKLTISVSRDPNNPNRFKGRFETSTGRGGQAVLERDTAQTTPVRLCD